MKTFTQISLLAAGLFAALPFANAAATNDAPVASNTPSTTTAPGARHPRLHALMQHHRAMARRVAHKLDLSKDQVAQLRTIRGQTRDSLKAIRSDASLAPDQKRAKARDALLSARTQMRGVLTPDQQAKFDQLRANAKQHAGGK
jgi:Spy/CpxP family protein refolding chaperone